MSRLLWSFAAGSAFAALLIGCGGPDRPPVSEAQSPDELERAISDLRFRVASEPRDTRARSSLARLLVRAELPGAAFRHYEVVEKNGDLRPEDRTILARLYLGRGRERMGAGDALARGDLERAVELDASLADEVEPLLAEAQFLEALALLRRPDREGRKRAQRLLKEARARAPGDARLAILDPEGASPGRLGRAAVWLFDSGAKRVALELLERYVHRGGRRPDVLRRYLDAHRWWYGDRRRPGLLLLRELEAAGLDVCRSARAPEELGCGASIAHRLEDAGAADALYDRARRMSWRTDAPAEAAAWTAVTLRAWLGGSAESWLGALTRRVEVEEVAREPERIPGFAAPTLLRAAGDRAGAREALDRAIETAGRLSTIERAVLVAEAAVQGRGGGVLDRLLAAGPAPAEAWWAALSAARARGEADREAALLEEAPGGAARTYLRRHLDLGVLAWRAPDALSAVERSGLARWWRADEGPLSTGRDALLARWRRLAASAGSPRVFRAPRAPALGIPDAQRLAQEAGLAPAVGRALMTIALAYVSEPAVADRRARDFVDRAPYPGTRGPLVAELFARLGDPARASEWWNEVLDASPRHPPFLFASAAAAVAAGDPVEADVLFVHAAALSGDGGAGSLRAARIFLDHGYPIRAIGAGRRALGLTARGEDIEVLELLAEAMLHAGRERQAARTLAARVERAPPRFRDAARAEALEIWDRPEPPPELGGPVWRGRRDRILARGRPEALERALEVDPTDPALAARAGGPRALGAARAWNPKSTRARAALLHAEEPGSAARAEVRAELLLAGLAAPPERAAPALEALAGELDRLGRDELAAAVRREGRALRGPDAWLRALARRRPAR